MTEVLVKERTLVDVPEGVPEIDYESLITEDDQPVDNIFSEKQQRLLVEPLYSSWKPETPFMAATNVGVYNSPYQSAIVPDMFLSLDVQPAEDIWKKRNRCYFVWEFGKPPEIVVEIVSNKEGGESEKKFKKYAQIGVWYYIIFDPQLFVQEESLRVHQLDLGRYVVKEGLQLEEVNLRLTLWDGVFEGLQERWLRWCDVDGILIPTGKEQADRERQRADQEHQQADQERQRADQERQRADQERQRAERLAVQLRALGVEPDNGG